MQRETPFGSVIRIRADWWGIVCPHKVVAILLEKSAKRASHIRINDGSLPAKFAGVGKGSVFSRMRIKLRTKTRSEDFPKEFLERAKRVPNRAPKLKLKIARKNAMGNFNSSNFHSALRM